MTEKIYLSESIRKKLSEDKIGDKNPAKRFEVRKKISEALKGRKLSQETKKKMSEERKKEWTNGRRKYHPHSGYQKGHPSYITSETKKKISKGLKGKKRSNEVKAKLSQIRKERKQKLGYLNSPETRKKISIANSGKKCAEETKRKMRERAFEYAKKVADIICPRIGKNEKKILDKLEQQMGYKIFRQFKCEGYFIDGHIPKLNLAIEIDEKPKNTEKDVEREKIIKEKLNCKFLRIKDYD